MSDIRKLLDTINEMATVSGSVAAVAQPMGGVKSRKKDSIFYEGSKCTTCGCEPCKCDTADGNTVDGTKTPEAPKVSEFGLWKNSALIGQEQRDKKKSKKTVKEGEDLTWDDPDLVKARKLISAKKKDGHTEFKGIDKAALKMKDKTTRKHPVNEPKKVKETKKEYNALDDVQDELKRMARRHKEETADWSVEKSQALNKKLANRAVPKAKLDELGNSLMPGGQRKLKLAERDVEEDLGDATRGAVRGIKRWAKGKPSVDQAIASHAATQHGADHRAELFRNIGQSDLASINDQKAQRERQKAERIKNKFAAESKRTKK